MDPRESDFLSRMLQLHPHLERFLELDPPRFKTRRGWRPILGIRLRADHLEIRTGQGTHRLSLGDRRAEDLAEFRRFFLAALRRSQPLWKVIRVAEMVRGIICLRILIQEGRRRRALVVVPPFQRERRAAYLLTKTVQWWDRLTGLPEPPSDLQILLPPSWSARLLAMTPRFKIRMACFQYLFDRSRRSPLLRTRRLHASLSAGRLSSPYVLHPYRPRPPRLLRQAASLDRELELLFRAGRWEVSLRGLALAWEERDRVAFGVGFRRPLNEAGWNLLDALVRRVKRQRTYPTPSHCDPRLLASPERWLESLIRRQHRLIDGDFEGPVYCQVPTRLDGEGGVLDILTSTRSGRLAVLELKAEKDVNLLYQGLDYWDRVRRHLLAGDLQRAGYFPDRRLSPAPPLLYLVSPLFEFHRALPQLRRHLRTPVTIRAVGINTDWRSGLKVLRRSE